MKKLLVPFWLTLIIFIGSAGVGQSADFQKGWTAYQSGDYATALREWKPLADQGHGVASYGLGVMYRDGQGVSKNYKTAVKWFKLAAELQDALGQHNLAVMYVNGQGVPQDYIRAYMWWEIAASSGIKSIAADAVSARDSASKRMAPAEIAEAKKLARECIRKKYKGC